MQGDRSSGRSKEQRVIGFLGGTGPEGRGLALRLALAGERVMIGSRDRSRATQAADEVAVQVSGVAVSGAVNEDVARQADPVFVVVPYAAQRDTLTSVRNLLAGKVVVNVVAPLTVSKGVATAVRVPEGSAALQAQAVLPDSHVAAAFQTISARDLLAHARPMDSDVVVCSDDDGAKETVTELVGKIPGLRAVDGGGLENALYVENFTALLLNINRRYKAHSAIRIVGI